MTRVTRAEEVLLLLRAHLQRAQRGRSKSKTSAAAGAARSKALGRVQALAGTESLSDAEFEYALVAGILEEEFGSATKNDVKFQAMVRDVLEIIRREDAGRELVRRAADQLRAAGSSES